MSLAVIPKIFKKSRSAPLEAVSIDTTQLEVLKAELQGGKIGLIAGSGEFPKIVLQEAKADGCSVFAICHEEETQREVSSIADESLWIKVGELGKLISFFKKNNIKYVSMAGGIDRVRLFGNVKLDARGAALMLKVRSMKDDLIMRGIADELASEGIEVIPCTTFLASQITPLGLLTNRKLSKEEESDIEVGRSALRAMSSEHIGQTVVVRQGVVIAVEAVEGTDNCILRAGELSDEGGVVVKCAKVSQDMRFDVPTIGLKTLETMLKAKARVLAIEAGATLLLDRDAVIEFANKNKITILGLPPLSS